VWPWAAVAFALVLGGVIFARFGAQLPAPSGSMAVGTTALTLERGTGPGSALPGHFTVQIWYPAVSSSDRAPYGTGAPGIKRWIYHRLLRTHAARDVALAPEPARAPVLVYVAGWGGERTENTVLLEELASHGFVVAAVGDPKYDDPPLATFMPAADFTSAGAYRATIGLGNARLRYEARRASAVLDQLAALDRSGQGRFAERLDLRRVGILGFSLGGAVALAACRRDARFKAAMNLDGWLFGAAAGYRGEVPYFLVTDRAPRPGPLDLWASDPVHRYESRLTATDDERQDEVLRYGGYVLRVAGADHLTFTDVPLYAPLHRFRTGGFDASGVAAAIRHYTVAFFESALKRIPSPLLRPGARVHPAMTLATWPMRVRR